MRDRARLSLRQGPLRHLLPTSVLLLALAVAGCSSDPPPWSRPGVTVSEVQRDYRSCQRLADDEAYRRSGAIHGRDSSGPWSSGDPFQATDRYETRRVYDRYLTACMQGRGYAQRKGALDGVNRTVEGIRGRLRY